MDKDTIQMIQSSIGYDFKNSKLLEQAFVRKSYSQEHPEVISNEVLEFYGDEALDFYISKEMYNQFSDYTNDGQFKSKESEKGLTEIKSNNVDTNNLAHCIWLTGFQNYLLMNESDIKNNVQNSPSVMADLFEAIIGAVVIDSKWNYKSFSKACKNLLKMLNFEINYMKWISNWCKEQKYQEPLFRPILNTVAFQIKMQPIYNIGFGLNSLQQDQDEDFISGACLRINELELKVESENSSYFAACMECAKKAYDIIQIRERNLSVGKPTLDNAVNQLNILYQKGFIEEPEYTFKETHDKDGNPIWHCECDVDELEEVYFGDSSVKKDAKKEAALGALCKLLDYDIELTECDDMEADK